MAKKEYTENYPKFCPFHLTPMKEVVRGMDTEDGKKGERIAWYCPGCEKQYDDYNNVIGIVLPIKK